jgi:hypothetical protein
MRGGETIYRTATAVTHDKSAENHLVKAMTRFINELNKK